MKQVTELKRMNLNPVGQFLLYRAIVCKELSKKLFKGDAWQFSGLLQDSFEEHASEPVNRWGALIRIDLADFIKENPGEFVTDKEKH